VARKRGRRTQKGTNLRVQAQFGNLSEIANGVEKKIKVKTPTSFAKEFSFRLVLLSRFRTDQESKVNTIAWPRWFQQYLWSLWRKWASCKIKNARLTSRGLINQKEVISINIPRWSGQKELHYMSGKE